MVNFTILAGGYSSVITALLFNPDVSPASLSVLTQSQSGDSPSWITLHPTNRSILYAVNELDSNQGQLVSFTIGAQGALTKVDQVASSGSLPAHAAVVADGTELMGFNYNSGNGVSVPLSADQARFGTPSPPTIRFDASGSHPHQVLENGSEVFVPDLGADQVWRLTRTGPSSAPWVVRGSISQPAGSGPRHAVIKNNFLYTLHELANTITQQTIPTLGSTETSQTIASELITPPGAEVSSFGAAELLEADGILYATNRNLGTPGPEGDAIAIFETTPSLKFVKHVFTGLGNLRGAALGGSGQYLIVGGRVSGGVVIYERIDGGKDLKEVVRDTSIEPTTSYVWL